MQLLARRTAEAVRASEDAAAQVYQQAIKAAAPRKTGQLARSVEIFESVNRKALTGDARRRLLVGPSKRRGFYGYFIDRGWNATGRAKRRVGRTSGRRIIGTGWFTRAVAGADAQAVTAAEAAFTSKMQEIN